ncbi:carbohydrate ABC transporter permease [Labrys wisconsinensis]|uniref:Maltose/maltodextrin transport system permease protein MalG n=1 Tax=Labrys wisconsinensis TaxID=425677 RepID=A0ABU0J9Y4_9HYPH|nr:carbohydrate ABC transporter permease [Labrys wisconsinensis]MDQ0471068.1 multiple sugar transport system permease protein [Labrys wisconsinensis]
MTTAANARRRAGLAGLGHGFGLLVAAIFVAPIAWTVLSSFKPPLEARQPPLPPWPTSGASLQNYVTLDSFGDGLWHAAQNSLYVAGLTVALTVVVSLLAGYGFSRFHFPGKGLLFVLILSTIMIPFQSILTPIFLILTRLGLQNTLTGLVLVYVTLQLPFSIFMMRNAFDAVPREIEEAARIDGAASLALLVKVMLPLVWPGLVTVALFAFLNAWNEFLAALVLMTDQSQFTLPIMMTAVQSGRFGAIDWGAVQAGVTVMMIPCLILFLLLQRYYIRGLTAGAVK